MPRMSLVIKSLSRSTLLVAVVSVGCTQGSLPPLGNPPDMTMVGSGG